MDQDPKIINFDSHASIRKAQDDSSDEVKNLFRELEDKVGQALGRIQTDQSEQTKHLRQEIKDLVDSLESRINQRLEQALRPERITLKTHLRGVIDSK